MRELSSGAWPGLGPDTGCVSTQALPSAAGYLAGGDERRLLELLSALQDTEVKALIAVRGGYGSTRLLDRLDTALIARNPKLLVGFSDITALHSAWARAGLRSLHAGMLAWLGDCEQPLFDRWVRALEGETPAPVAGLHSIAGGKRPRPSRPAAT